MKIESSAGLSFANPSHAQIAEVLSSLPSGQESFAALERNKDFFIQASGSASEGFFVEYYDKSEIGEFQACGEPESLSVVIDIFQRYSANDESWKSLSSWQALNDGTTSTHTKIFAGIVFAIFFAFFAFFIAIA